MTSLSLSSRHGAPQAAAEKRVQIWKVAANPLDQLLRADDNGCLSSLGGWAKGYKLVTVRLSVLRNVTWNLGLGRILWNTGQGRDNWGL